MTKISAYTTKFLSLSTTLGATLLLTVSCANQAHITAPEPSSALLKNIVHGKVIAADTNLPVSGATVYVPKTLPPVSDALSAQEKAKPLTDLSLTTALEQSMGCKVPTEPFSSFACTDRFGNFTIPVINSSLENIQLKFQHNNATIHTELTLNDLDSDLGTILFAENEQHSQKQKVAIVLDMGGKTSPMRQLQSQSLPLTMEVEFRQQFEKMYDIDENQYDVEFMPFPSLFEDKDDDKAIDIFKYKIVYLITAGDEDLSGLAKDRKSALLEFISKGGELYVTSLSVELDEHPLGDYI